MMTKTKTHDTVVALAPPAAPPSAPAAPAPSSTAAPAHAPKSPRKLLRVEEVQERVRIARRSIYRGMRQRTFPQCIKVVGQSFWIESEIDEYIEAQMHARYAPPKG